MTTHALAPHCGDPGCLVGVLVGRCTRCGAEGVSARQPCPAADERERFCRCVAPAPSVLRVCQKCFRLAPES